MRVPEWWTASDDEYLLDVFGHVSVADIAGEMGVDRSFVRDRAVWLRNRKENRRSGGSSGKDGRDDG